MPLLAGTSFGEVPPRRTTRRRLFSVEDADPMRPFWRADRAFTAMTQPLTLPMSLRGTSERFQTPDPLSPTMNPFRVFHARRVDPVAEAAASRRPVKVTRTYDQGTPSIVSLPACCHSGR